MLIGRYLAIASMYDYPYKMYNRSPEMGDLCSSWGQRGYHKTLLTKKQKRARKRSKFAKKSRNK